MLIGSKKGTKSYNRFNCKGTNENSCILASSKLNPMQFVHAGCSSPVGGFTFTGEK